MVTSGLNIWFRRAVLIMVALLAVTVPADAQRRAKKSTRSQQQRSVEAVKKDKTRTQRQISEMTTKLNTTAKELNKQINRLNSLNADIEQSRSTVERLKTHIDSLGSEIHVTADSINVLEGELEDMRWAYQKAMRELQPHGGEMNALSFIFSAKSFAEAYQRVRYLRQFSAWREKKAAAIEEAIGRIAERRQHLTNLRHAQDKAYRKAEDTRRVLAQQQDESKQLVSNLRKEDSALRKSLTEQKKRASALDRELDKLIAAEQARIAREEAARKKREAQAKRKASQQASAKEKQGATVANSQASPSSSEASKSAKDVASANARTQTAASTAANELSGSFESNKGKLLFPVSGTYKIVRKFGRQPHPTLPHVETDNSGIDIEVKKGAQARAVYAGKVSYIFKQDGFNSIVMVRHGKYITIYAGLASVGVKQGDNVKAGQNLGTIYSDPDDANRTILHFEIRNERQKLNPTLWVR